MTSIQLDVLHLPHHICARKGQFAFVASRDTHEHIASQCVCTSVCVRLQVTTNTQALNISGDRLCVWKCDADLRAVMG